MDGGKSRGRNKDTKEDESVEVMESILRGVEEEEQNSKKDKKMKKTSKKIKKNSKEEGDEKKIKRSSSWARLLSRGRSQQKLDTEPTSKKRSKLASSTPGTPRETERTDKSPRPTSPIYSLSYDHLRFVDTMLFFVNHLALSW